MGDGGLDLSEVPDSKVPSAWRRHNWRRTRSIALWTVSAALILGTVGAVALHRDGTDKRGPYGVGPTSSEDARTLDALGQDLASLDDGNIALLVFADAASEETLRRVEREWQANPRLFSVSHLTGEEAREAVGFSAPSVSAIVLDEDLEEVRAFVCDYGDEPDVDMAGIGADLCPQVAVRDPAIGPTLVTLELQVQFRPGADAVDVARIRRELERSSDIERVTVHEDGTSLTAFAHASDTYAVCDLGRDLQDQRGLVARVVLTGTYSCVPLAP